MPYQTEAERPETGLVEEALSAAHRELWQTYGDTPRLRPVFDKIEAAQLALASRAAAPPCYTCVWIYERVCRQLAEPSTDDQAALTEIVTAIEQNWIDTPASPQERPTPAAPVEVGSSAPKVSIGGSDGMATLSGTDRGHGEAGRREGGGTVDSGMRAIYAGNGAAHDLIARQLIQRLHLTESDRADILDVLRLCDLRSLSVVELDRLSIRTGCDTELTRAADFELKRRGYTFDPGTQRWHVAAPAEPPSRAAPRRTRQQRRQQEPHPSGCTCLDGGCIAGIVRSTPAAEGQE